MLSDLCVINMLYTLDTDGLHLLCSFSTTFKVRSLIWLGEQFRFHGYFSSLSSLHKHKTLLSNKKKNTVCQRLSSDFEQFFSHLVGEIALCPHIFFFFIHWNFLLFFYMIRLQSHFSFFAKVYYKEDTTTNKVIYYPWCRIMFFINMW